MSEKEEGRGEMTIKLDVRVLAQKYLLEVGKKMGACWLQRVSKRLEWKRLLLLD
jgi:hypothetical protein